MQIAKEENKGIGFFTKKKKKETKSKNPPKDKIICSF